MCLFKTGILNAKYESGFKKGWGDYEDNWDRIPAYKASQFRMQGEKNKHSGRFLLRKHSLFQQILPLTALKLGNPLFLTIEGSENSDFLLDKYICHLVFYQNIYWFYNKENNSCIFKL